VSSGGIRARVSYKSKNYEKTVMTKEAAKRWKAKMLTDLERAPLEASYVRGIWVAKLNTSFGEVEFKSNNLQEVMDWILRKKAELSLGLFVDEETANLTIKEFTLVWQKRKV